ncbi:MAG: alpha-amylase, partial [Flavobacterium sp.]
MIKSKLFAVGTAVTILFSGCKTKDLKMSEVKEENSKGHKVVVYQVFTRLFGNKNKTNKPWGTIEENGVGKFND